MKLLPKLHPVILLVFGVYAAVIFFYAARFNYNFSGFAVIGSRWAARELFPPDYLVAPGSRGYDGQFFLYIARDPLLLRESWRQIDIPAYRYGRILYPLLAGMLALGTLTLLPYTLVLVNLLAVLLGTHFAIRLLRAVGLSPWYAAGYGLLSGFFLCILRDLAGPVAMAGLIGGGYYYFRGRYLPAAVYFAAGILAREVVLAGPVILVLGDLLFRKAGKSSTVVLAAPLPYLVWSVYLAARLGSFPWQGGRGNFGIPLEALFDYGGRLLSLEGRWSGKLFFLLFLLLAVWSLFLAFREMIRRPGGLSGLFLFYSLLPFLATGSIWSEPWSYGRVFLPAAVLLLMNFCRGRDRLYLVPIGGHLLLGAVAIWWVFTV